MVLLYNRGMVQPRQASEAFVRRIVAESEPAEPVGMKSRQDIADYLNDIALISWYGRGRTGRDGCDLL